MLPLSLPKGGFESDFFDKLQVQSNKVSTKFLCVKTPSGKVFGIAIPLSNGPYIYIYIGGKHKPSS